MGNYAKQYGKWQFNIGLLNLLGYYILRSYRFNYTGIEQELIVKHS